jgi:phospholipase C
VYGFGVEDRSVPGPMTGFLKDYDNGQVIMDCFDPAHIPALTTLASEFALFNYYHASVPGPTEVNRLYLHSATSYGSGSNDDVKLAEGYPQRTIFHSLDETVYNRTWGSYYQDAPTTLFFDYVRHPKNLPKLHPFFKFKEHADAGTLPNYAFLEPRYIDLEVIMLSVRIKNKSFFLPFLIYYYYYYY